MSRVSFYDAYDAEILPENADKKSKILKVTSENGHPATVQNDNNNNDTFRYTHNSHSKDIMHTIINDDDAEVANHKARKKNERKNPPIDWAITCC